MERSPALPPPEAITESLRTVQPPAIEGRAVGVAHVPSDVERALKARNVREAMDLVDQAWAQAKASGDAQDGMHYSNEKAKLDAELRRIPDTDLRLPPEPQRARRQVPLPQAPVLNQEVKRPSFKERRQAAWRYVKRGFKPEPDFSPVIAPRKPKINPKELTDDVASQIRAAAANRGEILDDRALAVAVSKRLGEITLERAAGEYAPRADEYMRLARTRDKDTGEVIGVNEDGVKTFADRFIRSLENGAFPEGYLPAGDLITEISAKLGTNRRQSAEIAESLAERGVFAAAQRPDGQTVFRITVPRTPNTAGYAPNTLRGGPAYPAYVGNVPPEGRFDPTRKHTFTIVLGDGQALTVAGVTEPVLRAYLTSTQSVGESRKPGDRLPPNGRLSHREPARFTMPDGKVIEVWPDQIKGIHVH